MKLKDFLKLYAATAGEEITITFFDLSEYLDKTQKFDIDNIPANYLNARLNCFCSCKNSISVMIEL